MHGGFYLPDNIQNGFHLTGRTTLENFCQLTLINRLDLWHIWAEQMIHRYLKGFRNLDESLNRQLTGATEMSNAEAQRIFANCSPYETYVLLDVLKTTKNALRSHQHLGSVKSYAQICFGIW